MYEQSYVCSGVRKGCCWVEVELSKSRNSIVVVRNEGTCLVIKTTMDLKDIRTTPIIDTDILIASQRSHCQSIVIVSNVFTELFSNVILTLEKVQKLRRNIVQLWKFYFTTETAHAKLGMTHM